MNPTQKQDTHGSEPTSYALTEAGLTALAQVQAEDFHPDVHDVVSTDGIDLPDILRSAALYLQRHGWIQGSYYDGTSGVFTPPACLVGAIGMVCYGGPIDAPAQHFTDPGFDEFEAAVLHLDRYLLVMDGTESYEFNDAKGRTLDQVTDVLRQAAATPEHELIDALKAIDEMNDRLATSGITTEQILLLLNGGASPAQHEGEPHQSGTRKDCPACMLWCFCTNGLACCSVCSGTAEQADKDLGTGLAGGDAR